MIEVLLTPVCFMIDQWTKKKAEDELTSKSNKKILKDCVKLNLVYNEGAFLGFLKHNKKLLFVTNIVSLGILGVAYIFMFFTKGNQIQKYGVSLMMGGALGNIYDRVYRGRVVDFFSFKWKSKIYFNLADFFVFIGAFLVLVGGIISKLKK